MKFVAFPAAPSAPTLPAVRFAALLAVALLAGVAALLPSAQRHSVVHATAPTGPIGTLALNMGAWGDPRLPNPDPSKPDATQFIPSPINTFYPGTEIACAVMPPFGSTNVDLVADYVPAPGFDSMEVGITYNPAQLKVTATAGDQFLLTANGGSGFTSRSDTAPDSDGEFVVSSSYAASPEVDWAGVLGRITLTDQTGVPRYEQIGINYIGHAGIMSGGDRFQVTNVLNGVLAIGGNTCPQPKPDSDNDGILDSLDGTTSSGQDYRLFSNHFTDRPTGTTFGEILDRGGMTVWADTAIPGEGPVRLTGSGLRGQAATVSVCGMATLTLAARDQAIVTCGSAEIQVVQGPISATAGDLQLVLPTGTTASVQPLGAGLSVTNAQASITSISVNGVSVPPGLSEDDRDNDGFLSSLETFMGTDPNVACGLGAWPPDFNDSGNVNLMDVVALKPHFGAAAPSPDYSARFDLNADSHINLTDILVFRPFFGRFCL